VGDISNLVAAGDVKARGLPRFAARAQTCGASSGQLGEHPVGVDSLAM
jgi:hypothetical protein